MCSVNGQAVVATRNGPRHISISLAQNLEPFFKPFLSFYLPNPNPRGQVQSHAAGGVRW